MNPNPSVGHRQRGRPGQGRAAALVEAIERASEWELFDIESLPPMPSWVRMAVAGGFMLAGLLSLVGTLRGGL
jgi:hypothetical protein